MAPKFEREPITQHSVTTKLISLTAALALLSGGCTTESLDSSEPSRVVAMEFTPEHNEWRTGACISYVKVGEVSVCAAFSRYEVTIDDDFDIVLEQCEVSDDKEKCLTKSVDVTGEQYDSVYVGDMVYFNDDELVRIPR